MSTLPSSAPRPITREEYERRERRQALIDARVEQAKRIERGEEKGTPDTIYSGLQEGGWYSVDPDRDEDDDFIRRTRKLHVKEYGVSPQGDWEIVLSPAALRAVEAGKFCVNCENPQPEDDREWADKFARLRRIIGEPPPGCTRHSNCCYCGFKLGIHGEAEPQSVMGGDLAAFTPEQGRIMQEMFGANPLTGE